MTYWLPFLALIGNCLVSSIYNMCFLYHFHIQFIYRVIPRCWFIYFRHILQYLLAWFLRLSRSNALVSLYHVALDSLVRQWTILGSVDIG